MTRIRIFYPFVGGETIGGSHVSALKMIAALDPARFDPVIALHREEGALAEYIRELGLDYTFLEHLPLIAPAHSRSPQDASRSSFVLRTVPKMVSFLRKSKIDIVHTNDGRMHGTWGLPAKLAGCKFVWHHRQGPDARGVNKMAPLLADRILSVSEFSRPQKPVRSVDQKFQVLRSPFDFASSIPEREKCHNDLCQKLELPQNSLLLGYFGVLNDRKRPLHFVDVVAAVKASMPKRPVHGLIFGKVETVGSELDEQCRQRADKLGISDNVHLMGFWDPVIDAMAGVDALLITALNEPFGRTLIEAMHLGTPVVATRHGGNPEAITDGETGFLVDFKAPDAFVQPISNLAEDPALMKQITEQAQVEAHARYGLEKHLAQISTVYLELTKAKA